MAERSEANSVRSANWRIVVTFATFFVNINTVEEMLILLATFFVKVYTLLKKPLLLILFATFFVKVQTTKKPLLLILLATFFFKIHTTIETFSSIVLILFATFFVKVQTTKKPLLSYYWYFLPLFSSKYTLLCIWSKSTG